MCAKLLIINADDFGYCPERNKGILEAFRHEKISNTTLLVNGLYSKDAVALANNMPIGLHFNVTEGRPILPVDEISTLCNQTTGLFHGKFGFRKALESGSICIEHVSNQSEPMNRFH
jgi:predicted glycoside hydrolase/deacetylase ChbG (UPF0249 family)